MTTSTFLIGTTFVLLIVYADKILKYFAANFNDSEVPEEPLEIKYPTGCMFDTYTGIKDEIGFCTDTRSLNMAYVEIIIFSGDFPDSAKFTSELIECYNQKQKELKSHSY